MSEDQTIDGLKKKYEHLFGEECRNLCVGEGWFFILRPLFGIISHHIDRWNDVCRIKEGFLARGEEPLPWIAEYFQEKPTNPFADFKVVQVKSKFGGLRVYVHHGDEFIAGAIALAEGLADKICGNCGAQRPSLNHKCCQD